MFGRWGIGVESDDAIAAGVTPDPTGDDEFAWMMNQHFYLDRASLAERRHEVDIRSSRRFSGAASSLFMKLENDAASNGSLEARV